MKRVFNFAVPLCLELTGSLIVVVGVAVEVSIGGELGHALISVGSVLVGLGSGAWARAINKARKLKSS
jgi:hypothetical protein